MPELPEIETLARQIRPRVSGLVLSEASIFEPAISKIPDLILTKELPGKKVQKIFRQAKFLVFELSGKLKLWFHLGMTGQLFWADAGFLRDKHVHAVLKFKNAPQFLIFRDIRKFGRIFMSSGRPGSWPEGIRPFAKDPFQLSGQAFQKILKRRAGRIKSLLLNQRLMSGLGNIYADESLFEARVHPRSRPVRLSASRLKDLYSSIHKVLELAIRHGGSSIDDYIHADGRRGGFQNYHKVYGREKEPCVDCGALIRRIRLAGRSSFFCPHCQKL